MSAIGDKEITGFAVGDQRLDLGDDGPHVSDVWDIRAGEWSEGYSGGSGFMAEREEDALYLGSDDDFDFDADAEAQFTTGMIDVTDVDEIAVEWEFEDGWSLPLWGVMLDDDPTPRPINDIDDFWDQPGYQAELDPFSKQVNTIDVSDFNGDHRIVLAMASGGSSGDYSNKPYLRVFRLDLR